MRDALFSRRRRCDGVSADAVFPGLLASRRRRARRPTHVDRFSSCRVTASAMSVAWRPVSKASVVGAAARRRKPRIHQPWPQPSSSAARSACRGWRCAELVRVASCLRGCNGVSFACYLSAYERLLLGFILMRHASVRNASCPNLQASHAPERDLRRAQRRGAAVERHPCDASKSQHRR